MEVRIEKEHRDMVKEMEREISEQAMELENINDRHKEEIAVSNRLLSGKFY